VDVVEEVNAALRKWGGADARKSAKDASRHFKSRSLFMESRTRSIFFYFEHVLHAKPRTLRLNML